MPEIDVWQYDGPIYGDEVAPVNLHETFTDFMLDDMKYELMTDEQIAAVSGMKMLKYTQADNELSIYYNQDTGHVVAKWVDDLITRGQKQEHEKFWANLSRRFNIKSWGYVEQEKPRVYCSKEISVEVKDGVKWYSISQGNDIKQWLTDIGMAGAW